MLKKYTTTFLMMAMLAVILPLAATSADAQTRRVYNRRTGTYTTYKRPNVYQRHRKAFNIGIGAASGLLLGGLLGGRKGAAIGALGGAGGGYLVTKVQRSKNYYRPVRRTYRNY